MGIYGLAQLGGMFEGQGAATLIAYLRIRGTCVRCTMCDRIYGAVATCCRALAVFMTLSPNVGVCVCRPLPISCLRGESLTGVNEMTFVALSPLSTAAAPMPMQVAFTAAFTHSAPTITPAALRAARN